MFFLFNFWFLYYSDTNNLHCCNSSPALLAMATVGTVKWYSVFADGIVKVHPISQELSNENERRQYTKILKTWESHRIFLNDECIKSETVSIKMLSKM